MLTEKQVLIRSIRWYTLGIDATYTKDTKSNGYGYIKASAYMDVLQWPYSEYRGNVNNRDTIQRASAELHNSFIASSLNDLSLGEFMDDNITLESFNLD
jgi:hypothetical protein